MHKTAIAVCVLAWLGMSAATAADKAAKDAKAAKVPPLEKLTCRTGPNDRQARLIAMAVHGRPMEFAYYSRLGTRVCSIDGRRGDAYTKWLDTDGKVVVKLLEGHATLEYRPGHLRVKFEDVDRMRFCGMHGELNGTVEVFSNKAECVINGVFD